MPDRVRGTTCLLVTAVLTLASAPARAAIDISGAWGMEFDFGSPGMKGGCVVDVIQTGTVLAIEGTCPAGTITISGTIDPDSGALGGTGSASTGCDVLTITGTASPSSDGFAGDIDCDGALTGTFMATKCGNDVVDPGEDCDEGVGKFVLGGGDPCCSPACTAENVGLPCGPADACRTRTCNATGTCTDIDTAEGAPCETDDNVCTDDLCDGEGTCLHEPNTAPCSDGNFCTKDHCAGGTCVSVCSPCCDAGAGCTPAPATGCKGPTTPSGSLKLRLDEAMPHAQRLTWAWKKGEPTSLGDWGDPVSSTDYAFCLYRARPPLGPIDLVLRAEAAGGDGCFAPTGATVACWRSAGTRGFDFKNALPESQLSHDGLRRMVLRTGAHGRAAIKVKAIGSKLRTQLFSGVDPVLAQLRASNGQCWEAGYVAAAKDRFTFVGPNARWDYRANRASPSGAFLDRE